MIIAIVVVLIALVLYLEFHWSERAMNHISYRSEYDRILAEPGEVITQTAVVTNTGYLPMMYVRVFENLPKDIRIEESDEWMARNISALLFNLASNFKMYVLPRSKAKLKMRFSLPRRGEYERNEYKIEVGDLLGVKSYIRNGTQREKMVIMPRNTDDPVALKTLGGLMGDISVRRFIFEDPVLTMGFREYTGREPMKSISWTKTARSGELYVKQYDHTTETNVVVVLNVENGTLEQLESCYEIVRTACEKLEQMHLPYEFYTNGDLRSPIGSLSWMEEGLGEKHFRALMYGLGSANGQCLGTFEELAMRCSKRKKSGTSYILVTPPLRANSDKALEILRGISDYEVCILEGKGIQEEKP
ncbi:MAG: DUF58 domain-containing protein [Lachnospiraceae bacterium]|jgi:hypothetical protein|nr:DUF58 domain-containing protein [Lachnospiraceae bacterium]